MSSRYAYLIAAVAAVSGLLFGFDTAVINGALIFLRQELGLSTRGTEVATSSLLVGCAIGAAFAGWLTDRLGRKRILIVSALLFAASAVGAALPRNLGEFVAARLVGGLAIGVASVLAPLYIAEISPRAIRGRLVSLNQMAIVTGILLAYFVNWLLSFAGPSSWRWMFASAAIPSVAFFVALLFVPESPRFLVEKGREAEALAVLERVGGAAQARLELARDPGHDRAGGGHAAGALREAAAQAARDRGLPRRLPAGHRDQHRHLLRLADLQGARGRAERLGGDRRERDHRERELPDDDRGAVDDRSARPPAADDAGLGRDGGRRSSCSASSSASSRRPR